MAQELSYSLIFNCKNICEILKYFDECVNHGVSNGDPKKIQEILTQDKLLPKDVKIKTQLVNLERQSSVYIWNILLHVGAEKVAVFLFHVHDEDVSMFDTSVGRFPDIFYLSPEITDRARSMSLVHQGFKSMYTPCSPFVCGHSADVNRIYIAGHSMGGALANFAALDVSLYLRGHCGAEEVRPSVIRNTLLTHVYNSKEIFLMTFGSPASGNSVWNQLLTDVTHGHYQRFVVNGDPLPEMTQFGILSNVYCHSVLATPLAFDMENHTFKQPVVVQIETKENENTILHQTTSEFKSFSAHSLYLMSRVFHAPRLLSLAYVMETRNGNLKIRDILPHTISAHYDSLK